MFASFPALGYDVTGKSAKALVSIESRKVAGISASNNDRLADVIAVLMLIVVFNSNAVDSFTGIKDNISSLKSLLV